MNEDSLYNRLAKGILTDEEINNLVDEIMNIPVEKNNNCLSSYGTINVDDLIDSIKELRKVPTYDELLRKNKQLKEQLQQKEDIINKAIKKCNKEKGRTDFDIFINLNEQLKTLEGFAKKIDYNLHPIITEAYKCDIRNSIDDLCKTLRYDVVYKDSIKEILDNKGE